jgi:hypothetical protein
VASRIADEPILHAQSRQQISTQAHFPVATRRLAAILGPMKRHVLLLVATFTALSVQAQIFGPGGVIQDAPVGSPLGGGLAQLPQPRSLVFIQPPMQMPQSVYGPQPMFMPQQFPMMMPLPAAEPTNYTLPATLLGGVVGGYLGHEKGGQTAKGAAIGAAAGLLIGRVLDRQSERRVQRRMPFYGNPYSNPYMGRPSIYGSVMVITPPRIPASWPATLMFGRQPYIVGR